MDSSKEIENILRKLYETLEKFYPEKKEIDYSKYLQKSGFANLLNNQQGYFIILVDVKKLDVLHISGSVFDYTGYEMEEFGDNVASTFMNLLDPKNISFLSNFVNWIIHTLKTLPISFKSKQNISTWGLKLLNKNGRNMRWYMNVIPLEFDNSSNPTLIMLAIQDVTHLVKGEGYWIRGIFGDKEKKVFVWNNIEDKTIEQEIISEREKEVLNFIIQGLDTKSIAICMNISPNTVDNHRRNMLSRTGARDTTALIQLCRMMGVI